MGRSKYEAERLEREARREAFYTERRELAELQLAEELRAPASPQQALGALLAKLLKMEAPLISHDGEGYGSGNCLLCGASWSDGEYAIEEGLSQPQLHAPDCPWRLARELKLSEGAAVVIGFSGEQPDDGGWTP